MKKKQHFTEFFHEYFERETPVNEDKQVSLKNVSSFTADMKLGNINLEMVIEKLNQIRSGRSFKDSEILYQMQVYFKQLNDNEKLALYAFLKGLSQIVTGTIPGDAAAEPEDTDPGIKIDNREGQAVPSADSGAPAAPSGKKSVTIKPNVITKNSAPAGGETPVSLPVNIKNR
jgi:hypothetical protein